MEIKYTNTLADLTKFNLYHISRMLSLRVFYLLLLLGISWPIYKAWRKTNLPVSVFFITLLKHGIFWALFMSILMVVLAAISYSPKKNKGLLTEHKLTVSDAGLIEETSFNKTDHSWLGVIKISQTRHYIYIYISQYGSHVIPKRAFADSEQAEAFYKSIFDWWQSTQQLVERTS